MRSELRELRWVVQTQRVPALGPLWESIAAFNVAEVAERYAADCAKSNGRVYRVVVIPEERPEPDAREMVVFGSTGARLEKRP